MNIQGKTIIKFHSRCFKAGDCIIWNGKPDKDRGYGRFLVNGKTELAHHVAFFIKYQREPNGYLIHSCSNSLCVNPEHLKEGKNPGRPGKFSKEEICAYKKSGLSTAQIADKLGCSKSLVRRVLAQA